MYKRQVQERIKALRAGILYEIAHIESALDDPEHISLEGYPEELGEKNEGWKKDVYKRQDHPCGVPPGSYGASDPGPGWP